MRKDTAEYARHRMELAARRAQNHAREAERFEDRADTRRSKAWRSRDLALAHAAAVKAERAWKDYEKWRREAERLDKAARARERRRQAAAERRRKKKLAKLPPKQRRPVRWEYVLKVTYKASLRHGRDHHAVWWDVRFRKIDGSRATQAELDRTVRYLHLGEVPDGWEVVTIAWDRGPRLEGYDPSRGDGQHALSVHERMAALAGLGATMNPRRGQTNFEVIDEPVDYEVGEEQIDED